MGRLRAAVPGAALLTLVIVVGTLTYFAARDEPDPPLPPTTTTTTTTAAPGAEEIAAAVADGLAEGLEVPLSPSEARCVADDLLALLGQPRLEALAGAEAAADDLNEGERDELVRTIVLCVPPQKASALLSTNTTNSAFAELPGEGDGP